MNVTPIRNRTGKKMRPITSIGAGLAQFGISLASAWSKASDADKKKFPEWFKSFAGYKDTSSLSAEKVKPLPAVVDVSAAPAALPNVSAAPAALPNVDAALPQEQKVESPLPAAPLETPPAMGTTQPKDDYAEAWGKGDSEVIINPIEDVDVPQGTDLSGVN